MPVWKISNLIVRSTKKRLTTINSYRVNSGTRRNTEVFRARIETDWNHNTVQKENKIKM